MEHLTPICEPVFSHMGKLYVAHCVPCAEEPSCFDVCLYRVWPNSCIEFMGTGVRGRRRFVSSVNGKAGGKKFARAVHEAIGKELGE